MPEDKVAEFREKNIALLKELDEIKAKYADIDLDAVKADRAKLAELLAAKPDEKLSALQTQLDAEKTAHAATRKRVDDVVIENTLSDVFAKAGGRPQARAFIIAQAAGLFSVDKGEVKGTKRSPSRPGELMSVDEWLTLQLKEHGYAFQPSSGGGANPRPGGGGQSTNVLRNPTPQQLGEHAKEIAAGTLKIEYDH